MTEEISVTVASKWHLVITEYCDANCTVCAAVDVDSADVSSEVTSPNVQTDSDTSPPASDDAVVDKADDETSEAESDASLNAADKRDVDSSASLHTERLGDKLTLTRSWHSIECITTHTL